MVVACHAALSKHEDRSSTPKAEDMEKALDGNLCRCTGYRPILDACKVPSLPALLLQIILLVTSREGDARRRKSLYKLQESLSSKDLVSDCISVPCAPQQKFCDQNRGFGHV